MLPFRAFEQVPYTMTGGYPILVRGSDGRVAILRRHDDAGWQADTVASDGRWPTWSPDRSLIARSTIVPDGDTGTAVISTVAPDGTEGSVLHEGAPGVRAPIAPNVPHYLLWAPTSDALSYVSVSEQGLALFFSTIDERIRSHRIALGAPLFHSWSPDGSRIAVHAGTDVALFDRATLALTEIAQGSYGFRTPRFSPDGSRMLYAMPVSDGVSLVEHAADGPARQLGRFGGGVSFSWVDDQHVMVAVARGTDAFQSLWLVNSGTAAREPVASGPFVAFWPSPAGDRVALAVPTQGGDGRFALQLRDRTGRMLAVTEPFLYSDDGRVAVTFFDQYELSQPPWAPDGSQIVFCGRPGSDAVSASWGDPAGDYVYVWDATRGTPLTVAGRGSVASFPTPAAAIQ